MLTDAQRKAARGAMLGGHVSKAGLGRTSIRTNLWASGVLVYQLEPEIGNYSSGFGYYSEG